LPLFHEEIFDNKKQFLLLEKLSGQYKNELPIHQFPSKAAKPGESFAVNFVIITI